MVSKFGFLLQDGTAASFLASLFDMALLFLLFVLLEACNAEVPKEVLFNDDFVEFASAHNLQVFGAHRFRHLSCFCAC